MCDSNNLTWTEISYQSPESILGKVRRFYFPLFDDYLPKLIATTQTFYERDLLEHIISSVPKGCVAIDVGANIGNHTVYLASYLSDRVVSVEPHPRNAALLRETLKRNSIQGVTVVESAVSDSAGTAIMSLPPGFEGNNGSYRITHSDERAHDSGSVEVPMTTLDTVCTDLGITNSTRVGVIKIDVEGHELPVLRGARSILEAHHPHLFIEAQTDDDLRELIVELCPLGYRVIGRWCATPTYHFAPWGPARHGIWKITNSARRFTRRLLRRLLRVFHTTG